MSFAKIVLGAFVGIVLCLAVILFATDTTSPAIGLVICALLGIIALWKWPKHQQDIMDDNFSTFSSYHTFNPSYN